MSRYVLTIERQKGKNSRKNTKMVVNVKNFPIVFAYIFK